MQNAPGSKSRDTQRYKKLNNIVPRFPVSPQHSRVTITLRTEIVAPIRTEPCAKCGAPQVVEDDIDKLRCPAFKCGSCDRLLKWFPQSQPGGAA